MRKLTWVFFLFIIACNNQASRPPKPGSATANNTTTTLSIITTPPYSCDYVRQKNRCQEIYSLHKKQRSPGTERQLISYITDSLVPCWYGTPWDFNGTTQVPGEGKIACGYFVTTTLRDAGMKIDRVKMAQCVSQNLLYDLCANFKKFSNKPLDYFVNSVKKSGYGLYIVGLDNHTGYIYHDGKEVWFIHSGWLPPRCTLKERAIESETLRRSAYRVVGRIRFDR